MIKSKKNKNYSKQLSKKKFNQDGGQKKTIYIGYINLRGYIKGFGRVYKSKKNLDEDTSPEEVLKPLMDGFKESNSNKNSTTILFSTLTDDYSKSNMFNTRNTIKQCNYGGETSITQNVSKPLAGMFGWGSGLFVAAPGLKPNKLSVEWKKGKKEEKEDNFCTNTDRYSCIKLVDYKFNKGVLVKDHKLSKQSKSARNIRGTVNVDETSLGRLYGKKKMNDGTILNIIMYYMPSNKDRTIASTFLDKNSIIKKAYKEFKKLTFQNQDKFIVLLPYIDSEMRPKLIFRYNNERQYGVYTKGLENYNIKKIDKLPFI